MEENEMLELANETENVETETTEEITEGIELTDTAEESQISNNESSEETTEVKKTLKEILRENPEYQEEFNGMMKTRLDRKDREYEKELSKYRDTEQVLRKTVGGEDISEINNNLRNAYKEQGVELPEPVKPGLTSRQTEILAKAEAEEIIESGLDIAEKEANKLADIGYENMNNSQRIIFETLCEKLNYENAKSELLKIGAKAEILEDKNFIAHKKRYNSNVPIKEIYEDYLAKQPKKKVESPGSMKNTDKGNKDFISEAEYDKMSRAEIRANMDLIEKSMPKW